MTHLHTTSHIACPADDVFTFVTTPGERTLAYVMPHPLLNVLNWLYVRRRITAESEEALRRLKAVLEAERVSLHIPTYPSHHHEKPS